MKASKILSIFILILFCFIAFNFIDILKSFKNSHFINAEEVDEAYSAKSNKIEITAAAIKNCKIKANSYSIEKTITLPKSSIILSKDEYFAYIKDGLNFKEIEISPINITQDTVSFSYDSSNKKEEFVVSGSNYLRIMFLNKNNMSSGHSH